MRINKYNKPKELSGNRFGGTTIITGGSTSGSSGESTGKYNHNTDYLNVVDYGAMGNGYNDDTDAIQRAINDAYNKHKAVYFPSGTFIVTRTLWVYDGIEIKGNGIYNTIIRTPFTKTDISKGYVTRDKNKSYSTATNPSDVPEFDFTHGHNRFYIGDGVVGYYDSDRETNPNHPLYWANDNSAEFKKWKTDRDRIVRDGRWVGLTGREGYGGAVFKSSQTTGLKYENYSNPTHNHPQGTIHTGIRNVKFSDLQINTNSTDRGKDSAIDFQYKAEAIPSQIRETYDSSVLNVQLYNLYLFSLGRSGYRATRAVDHTIIGCYVRQTAAQGFYIDGVTSVFFTGCYCNSCTEGGYVLRGCNYCSLNSCASDSCSIGYNLYKCQGVTLNGCGCEATRYQKAGEDETEDPYKGRAYNIRNCNGVSLISCYTMTSHPKVYGDEVIDATDETLDENWLKSRHVFVTESKNVQVAYCYFKCFERIRSTPYRNADNIKCNYQGGTYDPTQYGSRYWQVQNYLVGAQFEVRGEESSVHIIGGETKDSLCKESEIRVGNLDLLDLGTVPNPLLSKGFQTAGRTMSGEDGNGGWTYTKTIEEDVLDGEGNVIGTQERTVVERVSFENFEFVFPINGKKDYGQRDKFWEWRNSLLLVRKLDDTSLLNEDKYGNKYRNKYRGYISYFAPAPMTSSHINWNQVSQEDISRFKIDIVNDYSDTTLIDGSKDLFSYGKFSWQQLDAPIAYEPSVFSPIPCFVRDKPEGNRITLNSNTIDGFPTEVNKASVAIIGNKYIAPTDVSREVIPGSALAILTRRKQADFEGQDKAKAMFVTNMENKDIFSVYEKNVNDKAISVKGYEVISTKQSDYNYINKISTSASSQQIVNTLNALIDKMVAHGFMIEPVEGDIAFTNPSISSYDSEAATITFNVANSGTDVVYKVGMAYSSTNTTPTASNNKIEATQEGDGYSVSLAYGSSKMKYVRFYVETNENGGESSRVYSTETYVLYWGASSRMAHLVLLQNYVPEPEPEAVSVVFKDIRVMDSYTDDADVYYDITTNDTSIFDYETGVAYSTTNTQPTYSSGHIRGYAETPDGNVSGWLVGIPYGNQPKYVRFYINTTSEGGESNRLYSDTYVFYYSTLDNCAKIVGLDSYVPEVNPDEPTPEAITFGNVAISTYNSNDATIQFDVTNTSTEDVYGVGVAYSPSNTSPTYSNNHTGATLVSGDTYQATITYGSGKTRYIRFYVEKSTEASENSRQYSPTYKMVYANNVATIERYVDNN